MKKVFLISVDGFRPEMVDENYCNFLKQLAKNNFYINNMRSMIPPITLPCFFSVFFGVNPFTHGVFYNIIPDEYKVESPNLFEVLEENRIESYAFFNWGTLEKSFGRKGIYGKRKFVDDLTINGDKKMVEEILSFPTDSLPNVFYLYLGALDEVGHKDGWMSNSYIETAKVVDSLIEKLFNRFAGDYDFIIHSDHGGYEYGHYVIMEEIMNVPFIYYSPEKSLCNLKKLAPSIVDIAPTILSLFNIEAPSLWEGSSIL